MAWMIRPTSKGAPHPALPPSPRWRTMSDGAVVASPWPCPSGPHTLWKFVCMHEASGVACGGVGVRGRDKGLSVSCLSCAKEHFSRRSAHTYVKSPNWKISSIKLLKVLSTKTSKTNYFQSLVSEKVCLSWIIGLFASTRKIEVT